MSSSRSFSLTQDIPPPLGLGLDPTELHPFNSPSNSLPASLLALSQHATKIRQWNETQLNEFLQVMKVTREQRALMRIQNGQQLLALDQATIDRFGLLEPVSKALIMWISCLREGPTDWSCVKSLNRVEMEALATNLTIAVGLGDAKKSNSLVLNSVLSPASTAAIDVLRPAVDMISTTAPASTLSLTHFSEPIPIGANAGDLFPDAGVRVREEVHGVRPSTTSTVAQTETSTSTTQTATSSTVIPMDTTDSQLDAPAEPAPSPSTITSDSPSTTATASVAASATVAAVTSTMLELATSTVARAAAPPSPSIYISAASSASLAADIAAFMDPEIPLQGLSYPFPVMPPIWHEALSDDEVDMPPNVRMSSPPVPMPDPTSFATPTNLNFSFLDDSYHGLGYDVRSSDALRDSWLTGRDFFRPDFNRQRSRTREDDDHKQPSRPATIPHHRLPSQVRELVREWTEADVTSFLRTLDINDFPSVTGSQFLRLNRELEWVWTNAAAAGAVAVRRYQCALRALYGLPVCNVHDSINQASMNDSMHLSHTILTAFQDVQRQRTQRHQQQQSYSPPQVTSKRRREENEEKELEEKDDNEHSDSRTPAAAAAMSSRPNPKRLKLIAAKATGATSASSSTTRLVANQPPPLEPSSTASNLSDEDVHMANPPPTDQQEADGVNSAPSSSFTEFPLVPITRENLRSFYTLESFEMMNYPIEWFQKDVPPTLICPICYNVCFDPPNLESCVHAICRACLTQCRRTKNHCPVDRIAFKANHQFASNPFVQNLIWQLKVQCPSQEAGCTWTDSFGLNGRNLSNHYQTCLYREMKCMKCTATLLGTNANDHQAKCPERRVTCTKCEDVFFFHQLEQHQTMPTLESSSHQLTTTNIDYTSIRFQDCEPEENDNVTIKPEPGMETRTGIRTRLRWSRRFLDLVEDEIRIYEQSESQKRPSMMTIAPIKSKFAKPILPCRSYEICERGCEDSNKPGFTYYYLVKDRALHARVCSKRPVLCGLCEFSHHVSFDELHAHIDRALTDRREMTLNKMIQLMSTGRTDSPPTPKLIETQRSETDFRLKRSHAVFLDPTIQSEKEVNSAGSRADWGHLGGSSEISDPRDWRRYMVTPDQLVRGFSLHAKYHQPDDAGVSFWRTAVVAGVNDAENKVLIKFNGVDEPEWIPKDSTRLARVHMGWEKDEWEYRRRSVDAAATSSRLSQRSGFDNFRALYPAAAASMEARESHYSIGRPLDPHAASSSATTTAAYTTPPLTNPFIPMFAPSTTTRAVLPQHHRTSSSSSSESESQPQARSGTRTVRRRQRRRAIESPEIEAIRAGFTDGFNEEEIAAAMAASVDTTTPAAPAITTTTSRRVTPVTSTTSTTIPTGTVSSTFNALSRTPFSSIHPVRRHEPGRSNPSVATTSDGHVSGPHTTSHPHAPPSSSSSLVQRDADGRRRGTSSQGDRRRSVSFAPAAASTGTATTTTRAMSPRTPHQMGVDNPIDSIARRTNDAIAAGETAIAAAETVLQAISSRRRRNHPLARHGSASAAADTTSTSASTATSIPTRTISYASHHQPLHQATIHPPNRRY